MKGEIEKGVLYVVATPIGNMGDMTERGKEILENVDFICAEDTRVGGKLLMLLGIKGSLVSYYEHNKNSRHEEILRRLLEGENAAIITDAGTPCISDPGVELVRFLKKSGVKVVPIPGASAVITALSACGIDTRRFVFEGFFDKNKSARRDRMEELKTEKRTMVFYISPHEYATVIGELYECFGDREIALCRELTKLNEEITLTTLESAAKNDGKKGEYVLVVSGYSGSEYEFWSEMTVKEHYEHYVSLGLQKMDACKAVAKDRGIAKNQVYKEIID